MDTLDPIEDHAFALIRAECRHVDDWLFGVFAEMFPGETITRDHARRVGKTHAVVQYEQTKEETEEGYCFSRLYVLIPQEAVAPGECLPSDDARRFFPFTEFRWTLKIPREYRSLNI